MRTARNKREGSQRRRPPIGKKAPGRSPLVATTVVATIPAVTPTRFQLSRRGGRKTKSGLQSAAVHARHKDDPALDSTHLKAVPEVDWSVQAEPPPAPAPAPAPPSPNREGEDLGVPR